MAAPFKYGASTWDLAQTPGLKGYIWQAMGNPMTDPNAFQGSGEGWSPWNANISQDQMFKGMSNSDIYNAFYDYASQPGNYPEGQAPIQQVRGGPVTTFNMGGPGQDKILGMSMDFWGNMLGTLPVGAMAGAAAGAFGGEAAGLGEAATGTGVAGGLEGAGTIGANTGLQTAGGGLSGAFNDFLNSLGINPSSIPNPISSTGTDASWGVNPRGGNMDLGDWWNWGNNELAVDPVNPWTNFQPGGAGGELPTQYTGDLPIAGDYSGTSIYGQNPSMSDLYSQYQLSGQSPMDFMRTLTGMPNMPNLPPGTQQLLRALTQQGGAGRNPFASTQGGAGQNPLASLLGLIPAVQGLTAQNRGTPGALDPASMNAWFQSIMQQSMGPQAGYGRAQQNLQDQVRSSESARGLAMSPFASGIENKAMSDFNIDWANSSLNRGTSGLGAVAGAMYPQNQAFQQNRAFQTQQQQGGFQDLANILFGGSGSPGTGVANGGQSPINWLMNQFTTPSGPRDTNASWGFGQNSQQDAMGGVPVGY